MITLIKKKGKYCLYEDNDNKMYIIVRRRFIIFMEIISEFYYTDENKDKWNVKMQAYKELKKL